MTYFNNLSINILKSKAFSRPEILSNSATNDYDFEANIQYSFPRFEYWSYPSYFPEIEDKALPNIPLFIEEF